MKVLILGVLGLLALGCSREQTIDRREGADATATAGTAISQPAGTQAPADAGAEPSTTGSSAQASPNENEVAGTWAGQIKVARPVSMFNYVGAESGDFAPLRFRHDSEAGKKILAVCAHDDLCEFSGAVEWLDETPPPDASAIGQIVRVDSVRRLPAEAR